MKTIDLQWRETFVVKSYQTDFRQILKMTAIFEYMQETAFKHTDGSALGYETLLKEHLFWVLSKIKIKVLRFPKWRETVYVTTWSKKANGRMAFRDFQMHDARGDLIAVATSTWFLLDTESRKPCRLSRLKQAVPESENFALDEELGKIKVAGDCCYSIQKKVAYSEIDMNIHVNNSKYIDWITDCFEYDEFLAHTLDDFQVNFISEAGLNDEIVIKRFEDDSDARIQYVSGENLSTGKRVFQSRIAMR